MPEITYHRRTGRRRTAGPTCVDIFAGAGGLAEGFRQSGFRIISGTDRDPHASATFRSNFPEASFFEGPIHALEGAAILEDAQLEPGELDCLIGGPPCQSFSYNNHQRSATGDRAVLFRDYLALVGTLLPKCLVMENVPGILTIGTGTVLDEFTRRLSQIGDYRCEVRILFAEDYGVPQRRRRAFFVATRMEWHDALFPDGTHGPAEKPSVEANPWIHRWERRPEKRYQRFTTVWDAIGDLPDVPNGGGMEVATYDAPPTTAYQRRMRAGTAEFFNHIARTLSPGMLERITHVREGGDWREIPRHLLPAGMQRARPNDHTTRYGRLDRAGLCCTILTKCDPHWGSYVHPIADRVLSVREAARLQSFPDRFRFFGPVSRQYEQVGNAVPPLMAAALGRAVRTHVENVPMAAEQLELDAAA